MQPILGCSSPRTEQAARGQGSPPDTLQRFACGTNQNTAVPVGQGHGEKTSSQHGWIRASPPQHNRHWGPGNSLLRGVSWTLWDVQQHPWPLPTRGWSPAVTTKNISRQCQMCPPGNKNHSWLRTTVTEDRLDGGREGRETGVSSGFFSLPRSKIIMIHALGLEETRKLHGGHERKSSWLGSSPGSRVGKQ